MTNLKFYVQIAPEGVACQYSSYASYHEKYGLMVQPQDISRSNFLDCAKQFGDIIEYQKRDLKNQVLPVISRNAPSSLPQSA